MFLYSTADAHHSERALPQGAAGLSLSGVWDLFRFSQEKSSIISYSQKQCLIISQFSKSTVCRLLANMFVISKGDKVMSEKTECCNPAAPLSRTPG